MKGENNQEDSIILPLGGREVLRALRGMEITVFLTVMAKLTPLAAEFIRRKGGKALDLRGRLDGGGMYSLAIPMRDFGVKSSHYPQLRATLEDIRDIMNAAFQGEGMVEVDVVRRCSGCVAVLRLGEPVLRYLLGGERGYVELPFGMLSALPDPWLLKLYLELGSWSHLLYRQFPLRAFAEWIFPRGKQQGEHNLSRFKNRLLAAAVDIAEGGKPVALTLANLPDEPLARLAQRLAQAPCLSPPPEPTDGQLLHRLEAALLGFRADYVEERRRRALLSAGATPSTEQRQRYADLLTLGKAYHRLRMGRGREGRAPE